MIEGYRLSPQQKHLWMLQQQGLSHQAQCAIRLDGDLSATRLELSLRRVIEQCEILRTDFKLLPQLTTPVQVIADQGELVWRTLTVSGDDAEIEMLLEDERRLLSREVTQMRATLAEIDSHRHFLVLTLPALCSDTASLHSLVRLVARFYDDSSQIHDEEVAQYVQFSEWQNELLEGEEPAGRAWWQQNPGTNGHLTLPLERELSDNRESVSVVEQELKDPNTEDAVFLFACWQALLWRLAQQTEFSVNYVCDGRKYDELSDALGLFAKAVPVTGRLTEGLRFDELLDQLGEATRMAYAWQENYQWPQNGVIPVQQTIGFEYTERPANIRAGDVVFSVHRQSHRLDNFKLHLCCVRSGDSIVAELHYNAAYLNEKDVRRLGSQFATLVQSALKNPRAAIDDLEILNDAERSQLLVEWNQTITDDDIMRLVHELFEEQVERAPDRVAVVCGDQRLTYAELNARSNCLAHRLRRSGVVAGTPVGLYLQRSTEMIVALLGILKSGGAYVPLDPEHPPVRLVLQLTEIDAPILLTQTALAARLAEFNGETICLDDEKTELDKEADGSLQPINTPSDLCYVIYTSGSTGSPKGVGVTHQNLTNYALFIANKLRALDTPLHFATVSTLSADLGNTCIFPSLISGGCLHVLEQDVVMDTEKFVHYFSTHSCDVLKIVPSHLNALLGAADGQNVLPRKYLLLGGELLSCEQFSRISAVAGDCRIINHYGPTETTVGSLTFDTTNLPQGTRSVPIGFPIANTQVYILDRKLRPAPIGVPGELYIGGAGVATGYLNKPEQTAERFITHTFAGEDCATRLYKTGDLTRRLADGSIEFLGRIDNQVKIRGFRIELGEIEIVLQRHEGVRQAVVLAREDEPGHKRLVAYIVPAGQHAPTVAELRAFVGQNLPDYMMPSAFVVIDALPLTSNGKIDRRALPAPDQMRPELPSKFVAARNGVEEKLAEIWKEVLGVAQVGINDNFFELGGDSIVSLQIIARAGRVGLRIAPKQLFEFPTIALLAPQIEQIQTTREEQGRLTGPVPLTPIQHWFFELNLPNPHHWNMSVMLEAQARLDPRAFAEAWRQVVDQYDVLRLRFAPQGESWMQTMVDVNAAEPLARVDLSPLPEEEHEAAIIQAATRYQSSLNLTQGPLATAVLFDLGESRAERLLIVVHHLAIDGVSWRILLEDLQAAYKQLTAGNAVVVQPKSSSFKLWAERLVEYAESAAVQAELPYWTSVCSDGALPLDLPNGVNDEASARTLEMSLDVEQTEALLRQVPAVYHTQINDALLTALAQTFSNWTGDNTFVIDLEGHGRESIFADVDLSCSPGWFTTHFPVKLKLEGFGDVGGELKAVKEQLRSIPKNGIGYGVLVYLSGQLRELDQPAVSFNYLGQFDEVVSESSIFKPARESCGLKRSADGLRPHVLEITAGVLRGELQISWQYSENLHRSETIEMLAENFIAALESIVAHCQAPDVGGFTPSDFPEAAVSQKELDKFLTAIELD